MTLATDSQIATLLTAATRTGDADLAASCAAALAGDEMARLLCSIVLDDE